MAKYFFNGDMNETEKILLETLESIRADKAGFFYPDSESDYSSWDVERTSSGGFLARGAYNGFTGKRLYLGKNSTVWRTGDKEMEMGDYECDAKGVNLLISKLKKVGDGSVKNRKMEHLDSLWSVAIQNRKNHAENHGQNWSDEWFECLE